MELKDTIGLMNGPRREMEESWAVCRTLRGGTRAMRKASTEYLPMTSRERRQPDRYQMRLRRTVLFPIYDRTVRKIASLPFQKPPTIKGEIPEPIDRIVENADRQGSSLSTFAHSIYEDAVDRGIGMILVDNVPIDEPTPLTQMDAMDARPYLRRIAPDNLVGFEVESENGSDVVTELRFRQWFYSTVNGVDVLSDRVERWTRTDVEVWERIGSQRIANRESDAAQAIRTGYTLVKTRQHGYPNGVPVVVVYTERVGPLQGEPPLEDLAWQNVSHWQSLSMQTEAMHYCRSPILKVSGVSQETAETKPDVGPGATITDTGENVEVAFVEIAGTSLAAGEVEIKRIEERCTALGMQPLVAVAGPSTATGEVRADTNEKSEAQRWIEAMEWAIYQCFEHAATWAGVALPEDFDWTLFRDSSLISGKAQDVPVIVGLMGAGQITLEVGLRELALRGVLATVDDPAELAEEVTREKEASAERQMQAMVAQVERERVAAGEKPEPKQPSEAAA